MGRVSGIIGKLLSFERVTRNDAKLSDVKVDLGGGEILTAEYTHPSGDDSFPLPGDYPSLIKIPKSGRVLVIGLVETDASQKSQSGDKRIYARNSDRLEVVELWLKSDGTATLDNANGSVVLSPDGSIKGTSPNGSFELRANGSYRIENSSGHIELLTNGTVDINGATIGPIGSIVSPVSISAPSVVVDSKELKDHTHPAGDPPGSTGSNN